MLTVTNVSAAAVKTRLNPLLMYMLQSSTAALAPAVDDALHPAAHTTCPTGDPLPQQGSAFTACSQN
jgi:hypothetical protein